MRDDEITPTRLPTITDAEARRRLGQAYRLLLNLARQKRAAAAAATAGDSPATVADPTPEPEEPPDE